MHGNYQTCSNHDILINFTSSITFSSNKIKIKMDNNCISSYLLIKVLLGIFVTKTNRWRNRRRRRSRMTMWDWVLGGDWHFRCHRQKTKWEEGRKRKHEHNRRFKKEGKKELHMVMHEHKMCKSKLHHWKKPNPI